MQVINMYFLGIDVGKNNYVASMIGEDGKLVFRASNTTEGGDSLLAKLSSYGVGSHELELGIEATGHY
jgi:predicted NBD/HSP70 family sugar kinase